MKHLLFIAIIINLIGCAKDEITIYNDYGGNPSDSTGYFNLFYHDFEPDIVLGESNFNGSVVWLDLNNDETPDIGFNYYVVSDKITTSGKIISQINCNEDLTDNNGTSQFTSAVKNLDLDYLIQGAIDFNDISWHLQGQTFNLSSCSPLSGDVYIGFRTNRNTTPFATTNPTLNYGWLRVEVFGNGDSLVLKDYAYNLIENSPIRVGDK